MSFEFSGLACAREYCVVREHPDAALIEIDELSNTHPQRVFPPEINEQRTALHQLYDATNAIHV